MGRSRSHPVWSSLFPEFSRRTRLASSPTFLFRSRPAFSLRRHCLHPVSVPACAQLRLSAGAGLSIILPSPHQDAVVSFTRDPGNQPHARAVGLSASEYCSFDPYLCISQEH